MKRDTYFPGGFVRNYFGNYWPLGESDSVFMRIVNSRPQTGLSQGVFGSQKRLVRFVTKWRR